MQVLSDSKNRDSLTGIRNQFRSDVSFQEKFSSIYYSSLTESLPLMLTGAIIPAGASTGC